MCIRLPLNVMMVFGVAFPALNCLYGIYTSDKRISENVNLVTPPPLPPPSTAYSHTGVFEECGCYGEHVPN